jgi:transketolase
MTGATMRERFVDVTSELLDSNDELAVVLAVIGLGQFQASGAVARSSDRIIDVGIREQAMIGVAAGMALEGYRVIAHSYAPFLLERPFEQVKLDFAHQGLGAILVSVGASHDWPTGGRTHMSPGDVALVATLPGWQAMVPGHPDEVEQMLRQLVGDDSRTYVRLADGANARPHVGGIGRLLSIRHGSPGAPLIIAMGPMLDRTLAAVSGLDVSVAYTATPLPIDAQGVRSMIGAGDVVVVVEPYLEGTSAAQIGAALRERPHRLLSIGVGTEELRRYGTPAEHDAARGLDAHGIRRRITDLLGGSTPNRLDLAVLV